MITTPEELTQHVHTLIPIAAAMGVRVTEVGDGTASIELPAEPNGNHFGAIYAGSLFTVAELLGGVIPQSSFDFAGELAGYVPLLKSSEITFRRPAIGAVTASASLAPEVRERVRTEALANGKSEFVLEAVIVDGEGTVVAETRGVLQVRKMG
jgi:thioesterase domain-containing protein